MTDREAMKMAWEGLENLTTYEYKRSNIFRYYYPSATGNYVELLEFREKSTPAIEALRQALAQPEQAFKYTPYGLRSDENGKLSIGEISQREWVGLTDEEIKGILDCGRGGLVDIKKAEQILKKKNK